jgi:hypothetical protein
MSDMSGRPFAVVNGLGELAGCHATRAAAVIQMTMLNVHDADTLEASAEEKSAVVVEAPVLGKPYNPPPIPYTTPTTQTW